MRFYVFYGSKNYANRNNKNLRATTPGIVTTS